MTEDQLRLLPGVLDCRAEGGALVVVVHPEVDARVLRSQVAAVCATCGDVRPVEVRGGLRTAASPAGWRTAVGGTPTSPLRVAGFGVLVLMALWLLPGGGGGAAPSGAGRQVAAGSPDLREVGGALRAAGSAGFAPRDAGAARDGGPSASLRRPALGDGPAALYPGADLPPAALQSAAVTVVTPSG